MGISPIQIKNKTLTDSKSMLNAVSFNAYSSNGSTWINTETQLDRIENMLNELLAEKIALKKLQS